MTFDVQSYAIVSVPGLYYAPDYLNQDEQNQLVELIGQQPWLTDLKRRVQHYGYRYNYSHRTIDSSMFLGPLPEWAARLAQRLNHDGFIARIPDQLIVNEYEPGQGISGHIDCVPCFGETVLSISLNSTCVMMFKHRKSNTQVPILLEPGSLTKMTGESRYTWQHSIPARKTDMYNGQKFIRQRRLSLTFRTVLR